MYKKGYHHWVAYIDDWNDFANTKTFEGYRGISVHQFNEMIKEAKKTLLCWIINIFCIFVI